MAGKEARLAADASAWTGSDFKARREWVRNFTPEMLDEIDRAMRQIAARGIEPGTITRDDFPIPTAAGLLREVHDELDTGRGFAVVAGFPAERYSYEENLVAYCGIGANIGQIVDQSHKRNRIQDVIDQGLPYGEQYRGYSGNQQLPFHTDGGDVAALFCLETAAQGGESLILSTTAVYNEVVRNRPDLLDIYFRGFPYHRRGEQRPGEPPITPPIPVFGFRDGIFHSCYDRPPIEWARKETGVPFTPREQEALDYIEEIIQRPGMALEMGFQRGDMQFINNLVTLHARNEYVDAPGRKRHLLRLWLNLPEGKRSGPNKISLFAPWDERVKLAS